MGLVRRLVGWGLCAAAMLAAGVAAAACLDTPEQAGMLPLGGKVFVDPAASPDQVATNLALIGMARQRVADFYGELQARPNIVFCASSDCYREFGAVGLGFTDGANIVISPGGRSVAIIAHELAHVELSARIGGFSKVLKEVPQWFDEGHAVMVSQAEEFSDHAWNMATDEGRKAPGLAALATMDDWARVTGAKGENMQRSYGTARREVSRWFGHCGSAGFLALLRALRDNEPFAQAYSRIEADTIRGLASAAAGSGRRVSAARATDLPSPAPGGPDRAAW